MSSMLNSVNKASEDLVNEFDGNLFIVLIIVFSLGYLLCKCVLNEGFSIDQLFHLDDSDDSDDSDDPSPSPGPSPGPGPGPGPAPATHVCASGDKRLIRHCSFTTHTTRQR